MKRPNLPLFSTRLPPHLGQMPRLSSSTMVICPSLSTFTFFLFLHSGLPVQTRYSPFLPHRSTMGFPHLSHTMEVSFSSCFRFFMVLLAVESSPCRRA